MTQKKLARSSRLALVLLTVSTLVAVIAEPAYAYPPGNVITLNASSVQVARKANVTFSITNARPGVVTLKFGTLIKRTVASSSYRTPSIVVAPSAAGIYVTTATAADNEKATTRIYVPSATISTSARVGAVTTAVIRYAKPGSVVSVTVSGESFYGVVGAASTAVIPYTLFDPGVNTVDITIGTVAISGLKITGR